jgi:propionyl-CoA synthetase
VPVIDHWWQTETGWPICANCLGIEPLPVKPGSARPCPCPATTCASSNVYEEEPNPTDWQHHHQAAPAAGCLPTLWHNDDRYKQTYLSKLPRLLQHRRCRHSRTKTATCSIMSRTDDIINVAGHRLSTGGMEEVLASHPDVAECAVIGVADELKGHHRQSGHFGRNRQRFSSIGLSAQICGFPESVQG